MAVPLASAFVRLRPDANEAEFRKSGQQAGKAAGDEVSKGVSRGLKEGTAGGATKSGSDAGKAYADGFYRDSAGKLRQANGRFATDAQKQMIEGGRKAGAGFGKNFSDTGGGTIKKGFNKLKGELGPLLVPLGIGAAVLAIGKIGMTYEDNLNIFRVVTKATGAQMDLVAEKARALGADVQLPGVSAAGAAEAMTELSKAGFSVQQSMDAARGTLQLARIANLSEADAAVIAANAVNAFGIKAGDTSMVVDQLAAAANSSSVEISDVSNSFKMAAAVFAGVQAPAIGSKEAITELNTAIAILGNNGIRGSDAGTSLKQMLLQLTGPTAKASIQMQVLALRANGAKISQTQLNDALRGTASDQRGALKEILAANPALKDSGNIAYTSAGKMRGLKDIIALTAAGTKGMTQEQRNFAITQIFGADASRSVLALLKGGLPVYEQQRQAVLRSGAAADVAAAKNAGLKGAIDNVKSQFENMAISVYNAVKGPLTSGVNGLANILAPAAGQITRMAGFVRDNIGTFRDWAIAIGAVTLAIKLNSAMLAVNIAGGLIAYLRTIRIVTTTTKLWAAGQAVLNASLIANPIGIVIIALTALVAGVILAYRHSETFRKIVDGAWRGIKAAVAATVNWIVTYVWPVILKVWDGIATGALWLWRNAIKPAWDGIVAAVGVAIRYVKAAIEAGIIVFNAVATVVRWLYNNIFKPVFDAIRKVVEVWWLGVKVVFGALRLFFESVIFPVVRFLYNNIFAPIFGAIRKAVEIWWLAVRVVFTAFVKVGIASLKAGLAIAKAAFNVVFNFVAGLIKQWWGGAKAVFALFVQYVVGPIKTSLVSIKNFFVATFNAIAAKVSSWWKANVKPILDQAKAGWKALSDAFSRVYEKNIKPLFDKFVGFIKYNVVKGFITGVNAIKAAWEKVKEYARKPIEFVVNSVINPFINGLNKAAKIVGVKDHVDPIKFHDGGQVLGYARGGRIGGTPGMTDNRQAMVSGLGPVQLNGGEFVVNAKDTRKALPLLNWVNRGMAGGPAKAARYIGRPPTSTPGDGSEGWAFKNGGLIGWTDDLWSSLLNPAAAIKKPFEAALRNIPGSGMVRDFLIGNAKRLLNGAVGWLGSFGGSGSKSIARYTGPTTGRVGAAASFVQSQAGKPYVWNSAGPGGYDCSGIVSAAYNILKGAPIHQHTFSTGGLPGPYFQTGRQSPLMAGWSHPGQAPAGPGTGHMAGQIANLPFESRGSKGVVIGSAARKIGQFAHVGGARLHSGGQVAPSVFDGGGRWASGTLGLNTSGHTEHVMTGGPGGDMDRQNALLLAILNRLGGVGGDVADALNSNTRLGVQRGRAYGTGKVRPA